MAVDARRKRKHEEALAEDERKAGRKRRCAYEVAIYRACGRKSHAPPDSDAIRETVLELVPQEAKDAVELYLYREMNQYDNEPFPWRAKAAELAASIVAVEVGAKEE